MDAEDIMLETINKNIDLLEKISTMLSDKQSEILNVRLNELSHDDIPIDELYVATTELLHKVVECELRNHKLSLMSLSTDYNRLDI